MIGKVSIKYTYKKFFTKRACGNNAQDVELLQIKRLSSANSINTISDTKTTNDVNTITPHIIFRRSRFDLQRYLL